MAAFTEETSCFSRCHCFIDLWVTNGSTAKTDPGRQLSLYPLAVDWPFQFFTSYLFYFAAFDRQHPRRSLVKNDVDSVLFAKVKLQSSLQKVMWSYIGIAFLTGFAIIALALLLNFAFYFTVLPNIKPDNLLNSNILLINQNTILVSLYYAHPLLHAAISILFASTWAGLFSVFVTVTAIWIKNAFVVMSLGLVAQIVVLMLNSFIKLPNSVSYSPADFLHEMSPTANVNLAVTGIVTLLMLIYCIVFSQIGVKHLVP